jgi:hypothetical protein
MRTGHGRQGRTRFPAIVQESRAGERGQQVLQPFDARRAEVAAHAEGRCQASEQRHAPRGVVPFLAAVIAALVAILLGTTASASASVGAETRVGAFNVTGEVLVEPPEHVSAGQHPGRAEESVETVVATGVAAKTERESAQMLARERA